MSHEADSVPLSRTPHAESFDLPGTSTPEHRGRRRLTLRERHLDPDSDVDTALVRPNAPKPRHLHPPLTSMRALAAPNSGVNFLLFLLDMEHSSRIFCVFGRGHGSEVSRGDCNEPRSCIGGVNATI